MQMAVPQARERCWKLYHRFYQRDRYLNHDTRYRQVITRHLTPETCLLDAGCGDDMPFTREFFPQVRMAVGIDLEQPRIKPDGPSGLRADLNHLPFADSSFDVVISRSVIEHLSDPEGVFQEFARVLRPNGVVILMTPNKYDYVSLIAKVTPFSFHRWALRRFLDRKEEDTFPTFYRANTRQRMTSLLARCGLPVREAVLFNQYPAYLMFSSILFRLGVAYERFTSRYESLANLRGWLLTVAQKKG